MAKVRLTRRKIDRLPAAKRDKGENYYDEVLAGFGITAYPSGRKSFFIEYGPKNKRRRMTLGRYGTLNLDDARAMAKEKLFAVVQGEDPLVDRAERRAMPTFGDWVDSYMEDVKRRKKAPREDQRFLTRARKLWEHRPLDAITAEDVRRAMAGESADDHPIRGNRWLASVRACLAAAWRADIIPDNPAARVRLNRENPPRSRVLSDDELKGVVEAVNGLKDEFARTALLLLITTGARLSEVLRAKWEDVDLDAATWRIPSPKAGIPQIVPLHPGTVDLLRALPRTTGPWVIPGRNPQKPRADLKKPWADVKKEAKVTDITIHDLRRTFGLTAAKSAGLHVASKLLRHSDVRVTERVYAPLGLDDLREGLDKVATARSNVIPMRRTGER